MKNLIHAIALMALTYNSSAQEWLDLYNQSLEDYDNYQLVEAREKCDRALSIFTTDIGENHANTAAILRQLTIICYELGDFDDGIEYGEREIRILEELGKNVDEQFGTSLYNLGLLYLAKSETPKAEIYLQRALDLYLNFYLEDEFEVAQVQGNLAIALFKNGDQERPSILFKKSINTFDAYDDKPPEYLNIAYNYAEWLVLNGQYSLAIEILIPLSKYAIETESPLEAASIMLKIANVYNVIAENELALQYYSKAKSTFESNNAMNEMDYKICLNNLALLYQEEGNLEDARLLSKTVIDLHSNQKDKMYYMAMCNLAAISYTTGAFQEAEVQYQEVINSYSNTEVDDIYVTSINGLILIDIALKRYDKAISTAENGLNLIENTGLNSASLLKNHALALTGAGRYKEAEGVLTDALEVLKTVDQSKKGVTENVQLALASVYTLMGRYESAGELFEQSQNYFYQDKKSQRYGLYIGNYASYLQAIGQFTNAESLLTESIELKKAQFGEQSEEYLTTYENLCLLYLSIGKYELARNNLEKIRDIKQANSNTSVVSRANTINSLGVLARLTGDYSQSEELLQSALKSYQTFFGTDNVYEAGTGNEIGLLYLKMGNTKKAKPFFERALSVFETAYTKFNANYASVLENLATLYHLEGDNEKSLDLLEEVLTIDEAMLGTSHPLYSKTLHNMASIYEELENYEKSALLYKMALQLEEKVYGKDHPSYANTLFNIAVLHQQQNNLDSALEFYEEALQIRKNILNDEHPDLAYSIYGIAAIKQKMGEFESARINYLDAISRYLKSISNYFPSLSESEKSAFYGKIQPVFEAFKDFSVEYVLTKKGTEESRIELLAELYNLQLSTKALLLNATNKVRIRILNSGNPSLIKAYNQWKATKEDIVKALGMSKEELSQNNIDIARLELKANDLEKQLSKLSNIFANEYDQQIINWSTVQSVLKSDEAAIEIIRIKKNIRNDSVIYAGLILRSGVENNIQLVVIEDGNNLETKFFKQYKNAIVFKAQNKRSFGQFWEPFEEALEVVKTLYLSSDGVYNKVNVSTLYDPNNDEYLFDKHTILLVSNTRELIERSKKQQTQEQKYATLFGYPSYELDQGTNQVVTDAAMERGFSQGISELPGTLKETENIANTLNGAYWKFDKYLEKEASEINVKNMKSPQLLHIATHGFFMEDIRMDEDGEAGLHSRAARFNPLFRSGLLLAGASNALRGEKLPGNEDGILTAYEAMNLDLDETELVVMSACETGLGEVKNGEGVYGLQRAFQVAGADNLIMSLWKVNDETTQQLMSQFYAKWINGKSKQQAFRESIAAIKRNYPEPYYWGAFILLGK